MSIFDDNALNWSTDENPLQRSMSEKSPPALPTADLKSHYMHRRPATDTHRKPENASFGLGSSSIQIANVTSATRISPGNSLSINKNIKRDVTRGQRHRHDTLVNHSTVKTRKDPLSLSVIKNSVGMSATKRKSGEADDSPTNSHPTSAVKSSADRSIIGAKMRRVDTNQEASSTRSNKRSSETMPARLERFKGLELSHSSKTYGTRSRAGTVPGRSSIKQQSNEVIDLVDDDVDDEKVEPQQIGSSEYLEVHSQQLQAVFRYSPSRKNAYLEQMEKRMKNEDGCSQEEEPRLSYGSCPSLGIAEGFIPASHIFLGLVDMHTLAGATNTGSECQSRMILRFDGIGQLLVLGVTGRSRDDIGLRYECIPFSDIRSIWFGSTGLAKEKSAFLAVQVLADTKLENVVVGRGKMLDPICWNELDNPAKFILVLFSKDVLQQLFDAIKNCTLKDRINKKCRMQPLASSDEKVNVIMRRFTSRRSNASLLHGDEVRRNKELEEYRQNEEKRQRRRNRANRALYEEVDPTDKEVFAVYPIEAETLDAITIFNGDIKRLLPGEYLNDNLIDFKIKHIVLSLDQLKQQRMHAFSCMFYAKLTEVANDIEQHSLVSRWTKNLDLFSRDFILVPINMSLHWSLAVIIQPGAVIRHIEEFYRNDDYLALKKSPGIRRRSSGMSSGASVDTSDSEINTGQQACIVHLDSLGMHSSTKIGNVLRNYLLREWINRKRADFETEFAKKNEMADGTLRTKSDSSMLKLFKMHVPCHKCKVPIQKNGFDCGLFVTRFAEMIIEYHPTSDEPMLVNGFKGEFSQSDIDEERVKMKSLLLSIQQQWLQLREGNNSNGSHEGSFSSVPPLHGAGQDADANDNTEHMRPSNSSNTEGASKDADNSEDIVSTEYRSPNSDSSSKDIDEKKLLSDEASSTHLDEQQQKVNPLHKVSWSSMSPSVDGKSVRIDESDVHHEQQEDDDDETVAQTVDAQGLSNSEQHPYAAPPDLRGNLRRKGISMSTAYGAPVEDELKNESVRLRSPGSVNSDLGSESRVPQSEDDAADESEQEVSDNGGKAKSGGRQHVHASDCSSPEPLLKDTRRRNRKKHGRKCSLQHYGNLSGNKSMIEHAKNSRNVTQDVFLKTAGEEVNKIFASCEKNS